MAVLGRLEFHRLNSDVVRQVMRFIISGVMPNEEGEEELELDFSKAKSKGKTRWTAMQPFRDQRSV